MKYKIHRFFSILSSIFMFAILFLGILLSYTSVWAEQAFGNVTLDEIVFHLKVPLQGTDTTSIVSFVQMAFLPTVKICCVLLVLYLIPLIERRIRLRMERATGKQVIARIEPPPPYISLSKTESSILIPSCSRKVVQSFHRCCILI